MHRPFLLWLPLCCLCAADDPVAEKSAGSEDVEFFEAKIRPVLIRHCYECHSADAEKLQGGLQLDFADSTRAGGDSGAAVVPKNLTDSLLLSALKHESFEMPPDRRLSDSVIADFEHWISNGAVDPRENVGTVVHSAADGIDIEAGRNFWAFQPPQPAKLPDSVTNYSRRIDALVEQQLVERGIRPNGTVDRVTLLQRLSFDLIGLPPTREEVEAFTADAAPNAFETQVERLLSSPQYGERWTRLWLDVVRYAEDQAHIVGSNKSLFYPNAYRYRDWVINAFNKDLPYDRFLDLQIAADVIEEGSAENLVALGFIGLGPKYYRRNDPEVMADEWEDRVDVVSRGLQGLTVACARCHDHKYDPISTEDYYALAGVFAGTEMHNRPLSNDVEKDKSGNSKSPDKSLHVVRDAKPQDLAVMIRGDVNNKGDVVPRGFLQVMYPGPRRSFSNGSGRLELAQAITDPANPLTARVIVNRIWQQYFGRGLVATPSNFGQLGERPSHPELLDDLAVGFMNNGWSVKWLHRQIVHSATYQRSSERTAAAAEIDPVNIRLWRMPRRRLSVEGWRDAVLTVTGQLANQTGGPSIKPDDPTELRRTIYAEVSRFELSPILSLFDFPDPNAHSAGRMETNTPLQKLFLMNSAFITAHSKVLAAEIVSAVASDVEQSVKKVFHRVFQRAPDEEELSAARNFLVGAGNSGLEQFVQAMLASNEFWFVD
ncbi:MAG: PSD1 and planctomycete cytochrome C domain-containing protein [Fuerstiella sp.]|nr:PSD1 and planctomycete cytochrome C domain-containing protein [Fuerstiella sp.]